MYFDWTYLVLVVPAMIFAMWASNRVDKTFEKYQLQHSAKRITGAEAARQILNANGLRNVPIDLIRRMSITAHQQLLSVSRVMKSAMHYNTPQAILLFAYEWQLYLRRKLVLDYRFR